MHFEPAKPYHVYNRGNERQTLFYTPENYLYFLRKVKKEWLPYCDILAWCLMPNHFHFMLAPNQPGCTLDKEGKLLLLQKAIGKTLSSYTRAINKAHCRTGILFQKKTKAKCLYQDGKPFLTDNYLLHCLQYIHYNPVAAQLVAKPWEWTFSSASDYYGKRNGTLCNQPLLFKLGGFSENDLALPAQLNPEHIRNLI